MTRSRSHTLLAALVVALLLAAGCSDDSDDASVVDSDTTTESESTTAEESTTTTEEDSTTSTEDSSEAEALAEAVTLAEDDFEADWIASPDEEEDEGLLDCFSDVDLDTAVLAEFVSPNFSQQGPEVAIQVGSVGLALSDNAEATALMEEAGSNRFEGCALDLVSTSLGDSLVDADLNLAPEGPSVGDESVALTGTLTVLGDDGTTELEGEIYLAFIRTAEVVTGLSVNDVGETEFATVVDETTALIGDKQDAEVG